MIMCENLVKIYALDGVEVMALQGLDLRVEQGEMLGIVGASGSGKSTLLNVLGGLDRPSAGRVLVDGRDLLQMSAAELDEYRRTQVGFVWQQTTRNLLPYLNALENVELPMRLSRLPTSERRRRALALLETVGVAHRRSHLPAQLSGGEQQRVAIAVALANQPKILLADEPTGDVDTSTAAEIYAALRRVNQQLGATLLIVSHDPQIGRFTDRVVAIRDGKTSTETARRPADSPHVDSYEELAVLDSAGRLQLPREYLERLNIGDRVHLELLEEGVLIRPVVGRGRPAAFPRESLPAPDELYVDAEDRAPEAPPRRWLLLRFRQ